MKFEIENPLNGALFITAVLFLFASLGGCTSGEVEVNTEDGLQRQEVQQLWDDV